MKKYLLIAMVLMSLVFTSCERVPPNYIGVLMENYGKNGKSDFSLQKGRVWTASPGTELFTAPLYEVRGDFGDRVLNLKSADNTAFTARPLYSFRIMESRAVDVVFNNNQLGSGDNFLSALADQILEPLIYDLIKEESRKNKTDGLMADGGSLAFENALQAVVAKAFEVKGLELLSFSAQIDFTDKVKAKIDSRNEVNTNLTVLDQQILEQRKRNELEELKTQQNLIISRGLTPQILQLEMINAWKETKVPLYGNTPFSILKQ